MTTETAHTVPAPRWVRATIYAQILIAAVTVAISILAAREVRPLLLQREDLRMQVSSLTLEVKAVQSELSTYREALTAAREGINEYHAGDFEAAVRSYDSALRLDPSNANLLDLKGYSLFKAGKLEESVAALQSSVEADPHYAWGYFDLARTYCAMRKFPEAAKAADAAIRADSALRRHMDADGEFRRVCKPILARVLQ